MGVMIPSGDGALAHAPLEQDDGKAREQDKNHSSEGPNIVRDQYM